MKKKFTTSNLLFYFCAILYSFFVLNFYLPEFFGKNVWQNLEGVLYRYQTLLTGSIAIFSVSLISQQLRQQLRQHSDNAKLALKPEIDALVVAYFATVEPKMPSVLMALLKKEAKEIPPIPQQQVDFVKRNSSPEVANRMDYLRISIDQHRQIAELINSGENSEDLIEKLEQEEKLIDWNRRQLEELIENRHRYLKTFCPDLEIVFPRDEATYQ